MGNSFASSVFDKILELQNDINFRPVSWYSAEYEPFPHEIGCLKCMRYDNNGNVIGDLRNATRKK